MKKALIISVTLNLLIILFLVGKRYYYSYGPGAGAANESAFLDQWNTTRTSLFNTLPIDSTDIIFIGNSLTERFPVTELFGIHVKNRGIGGNKTSHILNRIDNIILKHPKKIFLEGGINDLNNNISVDSIFANFKEIISKVKRISPTTELYVQSVFPTSKNYSSLNNEIVLLNRKLKDYCDSINAFYVNIYPLLLKDQQLNNDLTDDGLHLNEKGYKIWELAVKELIK